MKLHVETDLEYQGAGPFGAAARPPCLQCPECIVSFMNLKYKQNKITLFSGNSRSVGEWLDHICLY